MPGDSKIFHLKLAIERDSKLSHGAARLGLLVCSHVYNNWRTITASESFPLPWTLCSRLCFGMSKRECYRNLRELVERGHFAHKGAKGCPAQAHFLLNLSDSRGAVAGTPSSAVSGTPRGAKCDTAGGAMAGTPRGAKKVSPLNNYFPSEEIKDSNGRNSRAREVNSSLRSKGSKGTGLALPPAAKDGTKAATLGESQRADLSQLRQALGKKAGKLL